jgi:hypothetical protein
VKEMQAMAYLQRFGAGPRPKNRFQISVLMDFEIEPDISRNNCYAFLRLDVPSSRPFSPLRCHQLLY